jgi:hypothetical protein
VSSFGSQSVFFGSQSGFVRSQSGFVRNQLFNFQFSIPTFGADKIKRNRMKKLLIGLLGVVTVIYLLNPTAGIFELLPDNIPFLGNVDEGLACYLLYSCIEYLRGRQVGLFKTPNTL